MLRKPFVLVLIGYGCWRGATPLFLIERKRMPGWQSPIIKHLKKLQNIIHGGIK
jgi:hypothetical protein